MGRFARAAVGASLLSLGACATFDTVGPGLTPTPSGTGTPTPTPLPSPTPTPIPGVILLQQHAKNTTVQGYNSLSVTLPALTTSGDLLVVAVGTNQANPAAPDVTDSKGDLFQELALVDTPNALHSLLLFYAQDIKPGSNKVTVSFSATPAMHVAVAEYSGANLSAPLVTLVHSSGSSAVAAAPALAISSAGLMVFAAESTNNVPGGPVMPGSGFSFLDSEQRVVDEFQVFPQPPSIPVTPSFQLPASDNWATAAVVFRP